MFYKITIKYQAVNESGLLVAKKEDYFTQHCELFGEAEAKGYQLILDYGLTEATVSNIKPLPNLREFVNETPKEDEDIIFLAKLADIFIDDKGKEKEIKYQIGVFAQDMDDANNKVHEYMKQGLQDMKFIECKETKIQNIL